MATEPLYLTVLRQEHTIAVDLTEVAPVVPRGWLQIEESLLTEIGEELARITALANKRATLSASGVAARLEPTAGTHHDVQRLGELIFSHLLPASVQQRLASLPPADLFLRLDEPHTFQFIRCERNQSLVCRCPERIILKGEILSGQRT